MLNYFGVDKTNPFGDYNRAGVGLDANAVVSPHKENHVRTLGDNKPLDLYNGNIQNIVSYTAFDQAGQATTHPSVQGIGYRYDQLNRVLDNVTVLKQRSELTSNTIWNNIARDKSPLRELLSYDASGNIKSLGRFKEAMPKNSPDVHGIGYEYDRSLPNDKKANNKLRQATGLPGQNQYVGSKPNYGYDAKGRMVQDVGEDLGSYSPTVPVVQRGKITWTAYDKVKAIIRNGNSTKASLAFTYDAMGNRLSKAVDVPNSTSADYTDNYVYDASGNVMAVYDATGALKEQYMYGLGMVGFYEPLANQQTIQKQYLSFMITDHLQSTRAVVSGVKKTDGNADVKYLADYYSNGLLISSREYGGGSTKPRFGYSQQEWDMETETYNFGARFYSPVTGRFWKTDAYSHMLTDFSPYHFAGNNPIYYKEMNGDYFYASSKFAQTVTLKVLKATFGKNNGFSFDETGKLVHKGSIDMMDTKSRALLLKAFMEDIVDSEKNHVLFVGNAHKIDFGSMVIGSPMGGTCIFDLNTNENSIIKPNTTGGITIGLSLKGIPTNNNYGFWHELGHFWGSLRFKKAVDSDRSAVNFENWVVNSIFNDPTQRDGDDHGGVYRGAKRTSEGLLVPQSQFNPVNFLRLTNIALRTYTPTKKPIYSPRYNPVDPPYKKTK